MESTPVVVILGVNDPSRPIPGVSREVAALRRRFHRAVDAGLCEVVVREYATLADIREIVSRYHGRIVLVTYAGHASNTRVSLGASSSGLGARALLHFLEGNPLGVVLLNGCRTKAVAQELLGAGIPAVIATSTVVDDDLAATFAEAFAACVVARGTPLRQAFQRAMHVVQIDDENRLQRRELGLDPQAIATTGCPWELLTSVEGADQWSFSEAVRSPLFGLPIPSQRGELPRFPFPGPDRPYMEHEARLFAGRDVLVKKVFTQLSDPCQPSVLVIEGDRGVGKTSLLLAALIPRLRFRYDVAYWNLRDPGPKTTASDRSNRPSLIAIDHCEAALDGEPAVADLLVSGALTRCTLGVRKLDKLILLVRSGRAGELQERVRRHGREVAVLTIPPLGPDEVEHLLRHLNSPRCVRRYSLALYHYAQCIIERVYDPTGDSAAVLQATLSQLFESRETHDGDIIQWIRRAHERAVERELDRRLGNLAEVSVPPLPELEQLRNKGMVLDLLKHFAPGDEVLPLHAEHNLVDRYRHHPAPLVRSLLLVLTRRGLLRCTLGKDEQRRYRLAHGAYSRVIIDRYDASSLAGQKAERALRDCRKSRRLTLHIETLVLVSQGRSWMRAMTRRECDLVARSWAVHLVLAVCLLELLAMPQQFAALFQGSARPVYTPIVPVDERELEVTPRAGRDQGDRLKCVPRANGQQEPAPPPVPRLTWIRRS